MRRDRIPREEEGVATVVGGMLLMLLFVLVLSLVHREYVPAWVEENEAARQRAVDSEFANFKSTIDLQLLQGDTNLTPSSSFTLGAAPVPLLAPASPAALNINSEGASFNVTTASGALTLHARGSLGYSPLVQQYSLIQQSYQFGALLLNQSGATSLVRSAPLFSVSASGDLVNVSLTLVSLQGSAVGVSGTDTERVLTQYQFYRRDSTVWSGGENITFTIISDYGAGWEDYFTRQLSAELAAPQYSVSRSGSTVTVAIYDVTKLETGLASFQISLDI